MKKFSVKKVLWNAVKLIVVLAVGISLVISMIPFGTF